MFRYIYLSFVIFNLSFCLAAGQVAALPFRSDLNRGNDQYENGDYSSAGQVYNKILEKKPKDLKAEFNLGDSLYKEGKYQASQKVFEGLTNEAETKGLPQSAFYNLGNSLFKQENYKGAVKAYEEALKLKPKDKDAQFNLELAKKMLAMPKKEREKQRKEQEKKERQKKKEQQKKKEARKKKKGKDKEKGKAQVKERKPGRMSKEDALRILRALEDKEKHKAQKLKAGRGKADVKDW